METTRRREDDTPQAGRRQRRRRPQPPAQRHELTAARATPPGEAFTANGQTLRRAVTTRAPVTIWAEDPADDSRRNLTRDEDRAFWAWAAVEVLCLTGIRVEELTELTHPSLVQYRFRAPANSCPCC